MIHGKLIGSQNVLYISIHLLVETLDNSIYCKSPWAVGHYRICSQGYLFVEI